MRSPCSSKIIGWPSESYERSQPIRTSIRSSLAERHCPTLVGSVRRELLDHIIPLNEFQLRRLGRDYLPTITMTELTLP
jgi:hypothetical protein